MKKLIGFSLIEILVVLAIIGILSTLGIPLYKQHIVHEQRLEAITTLSQVAIALEDFYTLNNSYQKATLANLGFTDKASHNHYSLRLSVTNNNFSITAEPIIKDSLCGTLSLDAQGKKTITGTGKLEDCW